MKLLFDQNLSRYLVEALAVEFPDSIHVYKVSLDRASDQAVPKDSDFHQRSFLFGHPPKVLWVRRGNCSTSEIETILRDHRHDILQFEQSEEGSFLALL